MKFTKKCLFKNYISGFKIKSIVKMIVDGDINKV